MAKRTIGDCRTGKEDILFLNVVDSMYPYISIGYVMPRSPEIQPLFLEKTIIYATIDPGHFLIFSTSEIDQPDHCHVYGDSQIYFQIVTSHARAIQVVAEQGLGMEDIYSYEDLKNSYPTLFLPGY